MFFASFLLRARCLPLPVTCPQPVYSRKWYCVAHRCIYGHCIRLHVCDSTLHRLEADVAKPAGVCAGKIGHLVIQRHPIVVKSSLTICILHCFPPFGVRFPDIDRGNLSRLLLIVDLTRTGSRLKVNFWCLLICDVITHIIISSLRGKLW